MDNPKLFFRELDALLARISSDKSGQTVLPGFLKGLAQSFGDKLQIDGSAVFERRDNTFKILFTLGGNGWKQELNADLPAVGLILKHGSFIFDDQNYTADFLEMPGRDYIIPAGISINSPDRQLLVIFGLKSNWVREEVTLFLNALRTALNYRLFTDIVGGEMEQAVEIQKSLLPRRNMKLDGYDIYGKSIPALLVGGDFYEYFELDRDNSLISIGDASGHGLPAALLVRDVVIGLRMGLASEYKLVHILKKLNRVIQQSTYSSSFVSLFLGEIEKGGHLFYVNAGHPAPLLVQENRVRQLGATGMVLGFLKDIDLQRSHVQLNHNSILLLYTDGIVERQDGSENQFGLDRLIELVVKNQQGSAREITETIFKSVFDFGNSANWEDDATLVVIKKL